MATRRDGQIVETPTEARQAEPGPSVLALLTVSTGLAILILGVVWFVLPDLAAGCSDHPRPGPTDILAHAGPSGRGRPLGSVAIRPD